MAAEALSLSAQMALEGAGRAAQHVCAAAAMAEQARSAPTAAIQWDALVRVGRHVDHAREAMALAHSLDAAELPEAMRATFAGALAGIGKAIDAAAAVVLAACEAADVAEVMRKAAATDGAYRAPGGEA